MELLSISSTIMDPIKQTFAERGFSAVYLVAVLLGSWTVYLVGLGLYRGKLTRSAMSLAGSSSLTAKSVYVTLSGLSRS